MPRDDLLRLLRAHIRGSLIQHYGNSSFNIFDGLVALLQTNWDASPTTMAEIRQAKRTKSKGDLFEHFALLYFQHCYSPTPVNVWLLGDAPQEVLDSLRLRRNDLGIDLIIEHSHGYDGGRPMPSVPRPKYSAIQVKYRKQPRYKTRWGVTWQDLSTFYALVNRTGPYQRHIVLTNAHWARHIGRKSKQDQSICIGTLRGITTEQWQAMADLQGHRLTPEEPTPTTETMTTSGPLVSRPRLPLPRLRKPIIVKKLEQQASTEPLQPQQPPPRATSMEKKTHPDREELRRLRLAHFSPPKVESQDACEGDS